MYYHNKLAWAPKHIDGLAAAAFLVIMIFNRAEWKIRFLDWGLGALVFSAMTAFFLVRGRIPKKELLVITIPLLWMGYAFWCTPFVINKGLHLTQLTIVGLLTLLASFVTISVFTREAYVPKVVLATTIAWTLVNFCFFLAWFLGYYAYENGDFSGAFDNRNEFAVQTVTILALLIFFVKNSLLTKTLYIINFVLVLASLSVKGFLFIFFVPFFPIFLKARAARKVTVVLICVVLMVGAYFTLPTIRERINLYSLAFTSTDYERDTQSNFLRAWLIIEGYKTILKNPVFGVGVDNSRLVLIPPYRVLDPKLKEKGLYSHCNYVEVGLNAGIIGLILFYAPLFYIYFKTTRNHRYWLALKTSIILYLLSGIAMVQYNIFSTIFLYCLVIFLYFYYEGVSWKESDPLCCPCDQTSRPC